MGIENMNGGMTVATRRVPTISAVAPRSMPWGDELQIFASSQNENVYTNDWEGPFFGGYIQLLDTLKRTETPRRLKPVNIYYHFYSGDRHDSLQALTELYDWAMAQELHPVTASEYARSIRGSQEARFFSDVRGEWVVVNSSHVRTLRLPPGSLRPETGGDSGVIGYAAQEAGTYLHTNGASRLHVRFPREEPNGLRVESSNASLRFSRFGKQTLSFQSHAYGAGRVVLAGGVAESVVSVTVNGAHFSDNFDSSGRLVLELPAEAVVAVKTLEKREGK